MTFDKLIIRDDRIDHSTWESGDLKALTQRRAVAAALLAYGASQPIDPEVNALLSENPFAVLVGMLFQHGITAERAWCSVSILRSRLGHLDPKRISHDPAAVKAAMDEPPMLHRYKNVMPGWVVDAACRVLAEYHGNTAAIWSDTPTAGQLQKRLEDFPGFGQKKAAMATEILARDLHVPLRAFETGDVAVDVHVRRVFLRTRLAERDDREHMLACARAANPARPGALDLPTWLIGRTWCHPGVPTCQGCPLDACCPKDLARAVAVFGA